MRLVALLFVMKSIKFWHQVRCLIRSWRWSDGRCWLSFECSDYCFGWCSIRAVTIQENSRCWFFLRLQKDSATFERLHDWWITQHSGIFIAEVGRRLAPCSIPLRHYIWWTGAGDSLLKENTWCRRVSTLARPCSRLWTHLFHRKNSFLIGRCYLTSNLTSDLFSSLWCQLSQIWMKSVHERQSSSTHSGKLSPALNPFGCMVPSVDIQRSSRLKSKLVRSSLLRLVFLTFSMMVNLASRSKSCPGWRKWVSTANLSVFLASDRCPLIRRCIGGSLLPTYALPLHFIHSKRYMTFLSLQFTWWKIWYSLPVCRFLKVEVDFICLQHLFFELPLHGVLLPMMVFLLRFITLPFSILCPPSNCWRLGFLLYAMIGFSTNFLAMSLLTERTSQVVARMFFRLGSALF